MGEGGFARELSFVGGEFSFDCCHSAGRLSFRVGAAEGAGGGETLLGEDAGDDSGDDEEFDDDPELEEEVSG